jgi:hypothetical protein
MARPSVTQFHEIGIDSLLFIQKLQRHSVKMNFKRQPLCIRLKHRKTQQ